MPRCLLRKRAPGYTIPMVPMHLPPMVPMNLVEQIRALGLGRTPALCCRGPTSYRNREHIRRLCF
jgi:hypothetical protein